MMCYLGDGAVPGSSKIGLGPTNKGGGKVQLHVPGFLGQSLSISRLSHCA